VILFFKIHICRIAIKIFSIAQKPDAYISSIFFFQIYLQSQIKLQL